MLSINKLSKKLQHTYYSSNKKSFILNIDLDEINKKDISKNANKHDMELLSNLTDKKWKLLDKKRKLFKVKDEVSYNIQFREHDKKLQYLLIRKLEVFKEFPDNHAYPKACHLINKISEL